MCLQPVIVDFTATWCGPCQRIGPEFVKMADEFAGAMFIKVDVDKNEETAAACGIQAMPTFAAYKGGEKIGGFSGADPAKLRAMIEAALAAA
ncbi:thioredoxin-like protein [Baffinella frigidus]|nr:thioredoxin-like protein [Cryptophyta sp. CCMP2293]